MSGVDLIDPLQSGVLSALQVLYVFVFFVLVPAVPSGPCINTRSLYLVQSFLLIVVNFINITPEKNLAKITGALGVVMVVALKSPT